MQSLEANQRAVSEAGYTLLGSFVLPEREWWDDYYSPFEQRLRALRLEREDEAWTAALGAHETELAVVRDCGGSFGYVFYVMQKA